MSDSFSIGLTSNAQAVLARCVDFPRRMQRGIGRAMDYENELSIGEIRSKRLSFPRTQKSTLEGLRVWTNLLRASMNAMPSVVSGNRITSSIGSPVKYAVLHEFGGRVQVPAHTRRREKRMFSEGYAISLKSAARFGLLTKGGRARAGRGKVARLGFSHVRAYTAKYPARAYVRRTLEDRSEEYKNAISQVIVDAWKKKD